MSRVASYITVLAGLIFANFLYQFMQDDAVYMIATERSIFQFVAVSAYVIISNIFNFGEPPNE